MRKFGRTIVLIAATAVSSHVAAQQTNAPVQQSSAIQSDKLLSDELNDQLPPWLRFSGEIRMRVEGFTGGGFKPGNDDAYLLTRFRLNMKLIPTHWLKFVFQAQDAHAPWKDQQIPPYQDTMDLRLGYIELGDTEKTPVAFRVGRQELIFGEERLIGVADWTNTTQTFDGGRLTFRHGGYRLDAFVASIVKIHDGQFNESTPGNLIYGLYGGMNKLVPNAVVEPFFFWRRQANQLTEIGTHGELGFATIGFRWVGKLPANFDYGTEMARQDGSIGSESIGAWAGHWVAGYTLAKARIKPRLVAEYNYASGDHNPKDNHRGTFDQLYPSDHDKYGLADQVGWKNISNLRGGVDLKPSPKWMVKTRYDAWWLADSHDALYATNNSVVARVANGSAGRFVGQELDGSASYDVSHSTKIGAGFGHIFPGTFLDKATHGSSYNYPYAMVNYLF